MESKAIYKTNKNSKPSRILPPKESSSGKTQGLKLKASTEILDFPNPEKGVELGEVFVSDLSANDFDMLQRSLCGKFRTDEFYDKESLGFNLAYQTFMIAKENGISSERFRKLIRDFVAKFRYTINHWQPDDILKLGEQPKLYPRSWVMKQMREDKDVWNKVQGYKVGKHVLYAWKWDDVPLDKFVPEKLKPDYEKGVPKRKRFEEFKKSEIVNLRAENLNLKIKLEDCLKENNRLQKNILELEQVLRDLKKINNDENELSNHPHNIKICDDGGGTLSENEK